MYTYLNLVKHPDTNSALLTTRWKAIWSRHPEGPVHTPAVFLFRKTLSLAGIPATFLCHITADQRYRLFVNGTPVVWGPARGDLQHWRYETVDIAPYLKDGDNVLAVVVHFFGDLCPWSQITNEAALLVQGNTEAEAAVNTPGDWKVWHDTGYAFDRKDADTLNAYSVVGPSETHDLASHPWGWMEPGFDDGGWTNVKPAGRLAARGAAPYGLTDAEQMWWLVPRSIPHMEETLQPFGNVVRAEGIAPAADWPGAGDALTVPANTRAILLFDHGHETTAFPEVTVSGGKGATLRLGYAEALVDEKGRKGNRDEVDGRTLHGYHDTWLPDSGDHRLLRPLWWRTFRYVEMTVETGDTPLTIEGMRAAYTGYPFEEKARFDAPELHDARALWDIGWRTARLCAHETYMDCPYYEQLQYAGDTRIQCMVTLYTSGDARLFRNALAQLDDSRIADGLTQSRYPSRMPQVISPFSLWWIGMAWDYWRHVPDTEFVRSLLPGIRGVLEWFRSRLGEDDLLGPLQWWNFVDWAREWKMGVPPGATDGGSSILTLQYILALRYAADLEAALGRPDEAERNRREADRSAAAVASLCFDADDDRVADTPARASYSQHAAILAILGDAVPAGRERAVMERILSDSALTQVTFYFRFYLHRALVKAGLGDRFLDQLGPWRDMRAMGLTTWAENPEPTRSDCHAWSSSPNYEFLATVLGILPTAPGFGAVRIAPHLSDLTQVSGAIPHPNGEIAVTLRRDGDRLEAEITLPEGCPGTLVWRGQEVQLQSGRQTVKV